MCWQLSIMSTLSELVMLRCRGFWRKQRVKCMMWIVHSFIKQLIVTLLQQFVKFRQVGRAETASLAATQECICTLAVCRSDESTPRGCCIY